jgi:integrase
MMEDEGRGLLLLELMFGEAAVAARRGASARLMRWARAFEEWMEARRGRYGRDAVKQSKLAWGRLVRQCEKMPWEMEAGDIEAHAAWMSEKGYSPNTIYAAQGIILNFFRWCCERGADPECEAGFDPGAGVRRVKVRRYARARLLSREEVGALLKMMRQDPTPVGKRDYAFTLARLGCGAPLKALRRLRWGQIERDETGRWVRWRVEGERTALAGEAWEAIRDYLEASGRLERMQAEDFVFPPLREPGRADAGEKAGDWLAGRAVSSDQLLGMLKLYGRAAGIQAEKLTLMALRRTATRLRLEEGASLEEMQVFLDSREDRRFTKYRLGKLPQLPEEDAGREAREGDAPDRKAKPFSEGEGMRHGLYANHQPTAEVTAVLAEGVVGMDEEVAGLRRLGRGLIERMVAAQGREAAQLGGAYSLLAARLGEVMRIKNEIEKKKDGGQDVEDILRKLDEINIEEGLEPMAEKFRAEVLAEAGERGVDCRGLAEEAAAMRLVLRRMFKLAMEAEEGGEYARLADLYGASCVRLARLLKSMPDEGDLLSEAFWRAIDQALEEVGKEFMQGDFGG